jgi:hypothetical protein
LIGAALTSMSEELVEKIKSFTRDIVDFADSTGDEFGKLAGLAAKIGTKIGLKSLKMVPFIGSLVNFYYAWKAFEDENWLEFGWEMVSGILGLIPGGQVASALMDGYKIYAEIVANKEEKETGKKPTFGDIITRQVKAVASWFMTKIEEGKVPILSAFYKIGYGLGQIFGGDVKGGFQTLLMAYPALFGQGYANSPLIRGINYLGDLVKENAPGAVEKAKTMAGDAWGWMKEVFSDIGEVFSGFFDGIMGWIDGIFQKGKDLLWDMIPDVFKPGKEERLKEAQEVANAAGRRGAMDADIKAIIDRDPEAFYAASGAGAEARQAYLKSQGYGATSLNDGMITKNGRVTAFNNQDDILAAKRGGPIDKMLDGNSAVMKSIQSINSQQLNVLIEIRDSLKSGGNLTFNNPSLAQEFFE